MKIFLRFTVLQLLCIVLVACNSPQSDNGFHPSADTIPTNVDLGDRPIVDVQVTFDDSVFKLGEEIGFTITLLNQTDSNQVLLFDKPKLSSGGPWLTSAEVKQLDVVKSELRYLSKIEMESNAYLANDLIDSSYTIAPGKSITGHYAISNLLAFNTPESKLPPGRYEIQVFHAGNGSNKVVVRIEE